MNARRSLIGFSSYFHHNFQDFQIFSFTSNDFKGLLPHMLSVYCQVYFQVHLGGAREARSTLFLYSIARKNILPFSAFYD